MQTSMLAGAAAVLAVAGAVMAPALALGVPMRRFPRGRLAYYALLVGALVFLVAMLVGLLASGSGLPAWTGPVVALAVGAVVVRLSLRNLMPLRRVRAVADRIAREGTTREARDELYAVLRSSRPRDAKGRRAHAVLVLSVVGALAESQLWDDALRLLEGLDDRDLTPRLRATRSASFATCQLYAGNREGARRALAEAQTGAHPLTAQALASTGALLAALEGEPRRALAELDAQGVADEPRLERARGIARAHALAGLGDETGAREALRALRRAHGDAVLTRVQSLRGPASPLAAALLKETESPYRG